MRFLRFVNVCVFLLGGDGGGSVVINSAFFSTGWVSKLGAIQLILCSSHEVVSTNAIYDIHQTKEEGPEMMTWS